MRMVVTPVRVSPLTMDHWMGAAPRYLGSRAGVNVDDALRRKIDYVLRNDLAVTDNDHASAPSARRCSTASGRRTRSGWKTGRPSRSAASFTGEAASCLPRPRGRSGCVTTEHLVAGLDDAFQRGDGERGRPEVDQAQHGRLIPTRRRVAFF